MATGDWQRIVDQVNGLTPAEKRQLRNLLDRSLQPQPTTEEAFQAHLVGLGLMSEVKRPNRQPDQEAPVQIAGEPLSETIIQERR